MSSQTVFTRKGTGAGLMVSGGKKAPYLYFTQFNRLGMVRHGFSTRLGGVSTGMYASMNLGLDSGDSREALMKNYQLIGESIGFENEQVVYSAQTHTTNVRLVTENDRGKGLLRPRDYCDVDGLITNVPGIVLTTVYADCVPLFFVDPVKRVIGLSHSGWKGTVHKMGEATVNAMRSNFDCDPADILAGIGPSICVKCYEVSENVAKEFKAVFAAEVSSNILEETGGGKYQLDLWKANQYIMKQSGILEEHIFVTDICTCCNPDMLFSHRATQGRRGNVAAFLGIL